MRDNDSLIFVFFIILFGIMIFIVTDWSISYNLHHNDWKCVEEVQVGEDITNHECIAYKKKEVKE
jgi:hypothetical protein